MNNVKLISHSTPSAEFTEMGVETQLEHRIIAEQCAKEIAKIFPMILQN